MAAVGAPSSASAALLQSRLLQQPAIAPGDSTLAMKSLGCCLSDSVHLSTGGAQGEVPCLLLTGAHSRLMIDTQAGGGGFKGVHSLTHTFSGSFYVASFLLSGVSPGDVSSIYQYEAPEKVV